MKIGTVSELTGCNIETIRYYERIGLIAEPPRKGRYRDYGPSDVEQLSFVRRGRQLGFSLEEIRTLLDLAPHDGSACGPVQTLAEQHLDNVRDKIADLTKIEAVLARLVSQCGTHNGNSCPVVESLARVR